jgi:hypothetical protein
VFNKSPSVEERNRSHSVPYVDDGSEEDDKGKLLNLDYLRGVS